MAVEESVTFDVRDGMRILWDAAIPMEDGAVLRADVFLPMAEGAYPLILVVTAYGKNLPFSQGYPEMWAHTVEHAPEVLEGSTTHYISFEAPDPEKWTAHGYGLMIVDARGCGRSPGPIDAMSGREAWDYHQCIEWAAEQPWCTGKIGMLGMSYLGCMQWFTASTQPPHLTAIMPMEAADDTYRLHGYNGGIPGDFHSRWYEAQVKSVQHGLGESGYRNEFTGMLVSGDEEISEEERRRNWVDTDIFEQHMAHPLDDGFYEGRQAQWDRITIPVLSVGCWGAVDVHTRGNTEGFMNAASKHKWLVMRETDNFAGVYNQFDLQRRFYDWALKGEGDFPAEQPAVTLGIRDVHDRHTFRAENEWPRSPGRSCASSGSRPKARTPTSSWSSACSTRPARRCSSRATSTRWSL
jgi:putative CocE/NonD family hydrolase